MGDVPEVPTRSGIVALLGLTNAGKSTFFNALIETKLMITSPLAQTTRKMVKGSAIKEGCQAIFLDTPGLHTPKKLLQFSMLEQTQKALTDADCLVFVTVPKLNPDQDALEAEFLARLQTCRQPKLLVLNKKELYSAEEIAAKKAWCEEKVHFSQVFAISVLQQEGLHDFWAALPAYLPASPFLYEDDFLTDESERFFCLELIREAVLENVFQEVPFGVVVEIESFQEGKKLVKIQASIFAEKKSHQKILVGQGGSKIKAIGTASRKKMEQFLARKVFLDLQIKVLENWTSNPALLKRLGFSLAKPRPAKSTGRKTA